MTARAAKGDALLGTMGRFAPFVKVRASLSRLQRTRARCPGILHIMEATLATDRNLEVTGMFKELVADGYISPVSRMEELRFPGELPYVPTFATYGTLETPVIVGTGEYAELGQRTQRNFG